MHAYVYILGHRHAYIRLPWAVHTCTLLHYPYVPRGTCTRKEAKKKKKKKKKRQRKCKFQPPLTCPCTCACAYSICQIDPAVVCSSDFLGYASPGDWPSRRCYRSYGYSYCCSWNVSSEIFLQRPRVPEILSLGVFFSVRNYIILYYIIYSLDLLSPLHPIILIIAKFPLVYFDFFFFKFPVENQSYD